MADNDNNNNEDDKNDDNIEDKNDPRLDPVKRDGKYNKLDSSEIKREKFLLLGYIFILSFTCYGVLPGLVFIRISVYFCGF